MALRRNGTAKRPFSSYASLVQREFYRGWFRKRFTEDRTHLARPHDRGQGRRICAYLYEHGIKPLEQKAMGVQQLREDRETESEFITISYWESVEAMSVFAGKDPRRIHHLERDPEFLIELPESVQVLDIVSSYGRIGGSES